MHIFPNFVYKWQVQLYNEAHIENFTKSLAQECICYKVTLILIFTRQVAKPQNVTHRYCFIPYQCTATSTNYSSLHFHSE